MTENVLIFNSQAAGDCLIGTHTAKLYKRINPDSNITFVTRQNLVPTTFEQEPYGSALHELLLAQEGIDHVGELVNTPQGPAVSIFGKSEEQIKYDRIIEQSSWFSDLGIVKSQSVALLDLDPEVVEDTNTEFTLPKPVKNDSEAIRIAISGPLDWNRKTSNDRERIYFINKLVNELKSLKLSAELVFLGKDVERGNIVDSLCTLASCDLFIGPIGFHTHAAAGLNVDTIHITSVLPSTYDSPEYYHQLGWHRAVKSKIHCGTYACVQEKPFSKEVSPEGPKTQFGFWPKLCPYNQQGLSCIYHVSSDDLMQAFMEWLDE